MEERDYDQTTETLERIEGKLDATLAALQKLSVSLVKLETLRQHLKSSSDALEAAVKSQPKGT